MAITMRSGFMVLYAGIFLCLILVILSIVIPRFNALQRQAVRLEAQKLHQVWWFARQRALATGHQQTVTIDVDARTYGTTAGQHEKLARGVRFGVISGVYGPPSHPTHPVTHPVTFTNNSIECYPDGIVSSGTVYMIDEDESVLYALSVGVGHTSHVRMYRYDMNKHGGLWELIE